jgi:RND superfamily putative drug exporter
VLAVATIYAGQFAAHLSGNNAGIVGSDSQAAATLLRAAFPDAADETDLVVMHSETLTTADPEFQQLVRTAIDRYRHAANTDTVSDPYERPQTAISGDRHTALLQIGLTGDSRALLTAAGPLGRLAHDLTTDRIEVTFTGNAPLNAAAIAQGNEDLGRAESIGLPVAAIVLLVAFGSMVAATIPLALGFVSVLTTFGVLGVLSRAVTFDSFVQSAVSMIGIALGIDYSLFIVTRFREEIARSGVGTGTGTGTGAGAGTGTGTGTGTRQDRAAAIGRVLSTAGRAVLYSGTTVMISLSGLFLVRSARVRATGLGMMAAVLTMMAIAVTLLPAILALLGPRVNRLALPWLRRSLNHPDEQHSIWATVASLSMRRPVLVAGTAVAALGLLALPTFGLRFGADTSQDAVADTPAGIGMARVATAFPPGMITPITVVVTRDAATMSDLDLRAVAALSARAEGEPGVAAVSSERDRSGRTAVITIVPTERATSASAQAVVRHLRAATRAELAGTHLTGHVGGSPATIADMITENDRATPLVIGAVLAASWLLLFLAFRSVLLPFKAIAMNLLSVGAAFGVMVGVFQDGHGAGRLGVDRVGFIQVMIPLLAFALVFGLSMDYEVFMLSRMREAWQRTGDNEVAVRTGIVRTAPVITAAAAIMIVVFSSFTFTSVVDLQQLGFMLAVAVFIDATVVRLLLVPALMRLMGSWNWWLPCGPGRRLPASLF